ncbi:hypothetical protein LQ567_01705 [Niabella pedocola]|uniref:Outer membrane protein beta-barrel domain-containing protein n=1 Tax=Niabella pedocola TaxID=1752077 RepID=A0ABS8PK31_9BACT|nr:hypothetical protein [Niabella pedocola]MCD2421458.1 hypothetical protein [Niabella pedocola]
MFKRYLFLLAVVIIGVNFCRAQSRPIRYSGIINTGAVFGSNNTKLQVQTIHGIQSDTWSAGIGVSLDDYFLRSFPVFIDVRKDIFNTANSPFIYGEGGINPVWRNIEESYRKIDHKTGAFYEGGVGYKIGLNQQMALIIAAGYSFKSFRADSYVKAYDTSQPLNWAWSNRTSDKYMLRRIALKIGLRF